jgi:hypothetical protein
MEENKNNVKIQLMLELLSKERQVEIQRAIYNTIMELTKNMKPEDAATLHGKVFEITIAFDKEQPFQYVYFIGQLIKVDVPIPPEKLKTITIFPYMVMQFIIQDLEVYKQDNIDSWLDYKKKIEQQKSIYYENQTTGEKKISNEEIKFDGAKEKDITSDEMYEYYSEFVPKYSIDEYIDKFYFASRSMINDVFEGKIYRKHWGDNHCLKKSFSLVTALQNYFSAVDFTEFNKAELEQIGFINYRDRCMLIPIWAYPIALKNHNGLEVETVSGTNKIIGIDIDVADSNNYESRSGVVGFGLKLSSLRQDENK